MKKFKMELVWHNCEECPPEEVENDFLIATDGYNVYEAAWYRPDGFMIRAKPVGRWHGLYKDLDRWYWADIVQTVRGEPRFKGLIVDDLVEDYADYLGNILSVNSEDNYTLMDELIF